MSTEEKPQGAVPPTQEDEEKKKKNEEKKKAKAAEKAEKAKKVQEKEAARVHYALYMCAQDARTCKCSVDYNMQARVATCEHCM